LTDRHAGTELKAFNATMLDLPFEDELMCLEHERGLRMLWDMRDDPSRGLPPLSDGFAEFVVFQALMAFGNDRDEYCSEWVLWLHKSFTRSWNGKCRIERDSLAGMSLFWLRFLCEFDAHNCLLPN